MRLPVKIDPDHLRDAIVEIRYTSNIPELALIGYLHKVLTEGGYEYNMSLAPKMPQLNLNLAENQFNLFNPFPIYTDKDKEIKISINQNQITFNIVNTYTSWKHYFGFIQKVLSLLNDNDIINVYSRIGVRYISEYRSTSIFKYLKGDFTILELGNRQNTQIRTQFEDGDFRITTTIADNFTRPTTDLVENFSLIDVDAQYISLNTNNLDVAIKAIDMAHTKQKESFFSIINDKFIEERNPQYEE